MMSLDNIWFSKLHKVEINRRYQPAKFHWPRLSGSNFMRAGGKHSQAYTLSKKPVLIGLKLIFGYYYNTLAAGLHQVNVIRNGVILRVTESEILVFSFGVALYM